MAPARILLLGNYALDRQESMQRFSALLHDQLAERGVMVECIRPEPCFGKFGRGGAAKWFGYADKFFVFPPRLKKRLRSFGKNDLLHICDHSNAVYTRQARAVPHLVTCHDLLAIRSASGEIPENPTGALGRAYQRMILAGLNRAANVACVSSATRKDLLRLTKLREEQASLVLNGLNYPYRPMERVEAGMRIAKKLGGEKRFILHVGGNQWYKNRPGVVGIYGELLKILPEAPHLVLVGKEWSASLREQIEKTAPEKIIGVHQVDSEDLRAFYSAAELFLFPSLMEGFGWPVIESQACGATVVTTNAEPMTEAGGEAAVYIDPRDWRGAALGVRDLLAEDVEQKARRRELSLANAARFSTCGMIDGYLSEYARVLTLR